MPPCELYPPRLRIIERWGAHRPQQAACARHGRDDVEQHHAALGSRRCQKQRRKLPSALGVQHRVGRCVVVLSLGGLLGEPGRGLLGWRPDRPDRLPGRLGSGWAAAHSAKGVPHCAERQRIIEHLAAFRTLFHRYFLPLLCFFTVALFYSTLSDVSGATSWIKRHSKRDE